MPRCMCTPLECMTQALQALLVPSKNTPHAATGGQTLGHPSTACHENPTFEKEDGRKVSLREFLAWSVPFTLVCSLVCYVLAMLIWVLPYAK